MRSKGIISAVTFEFGWEGQKGYAAQSKPKVLTERQGAGGQSSKTCRLSSAEWLLRLFQVKKKKSKCKGPGAGKSLGAILKELPETVKLGRENEGCKNTGRQRLAGSRPYSHMPEGTETLEGIARRHRDTGRHSRV